MAGGVKVLPRGLSTALLLNVPSWLKALPDVSSRFLLHQSPPPPLDLYPGLWA